MLEADVAMKIPTRNRVFAGNGSIENKQLKFLIKGSAAITADQLGAIFKMDCY